MTGPNYEPLGLVAPSGTLSGNRERGALRAVLLSVLAVSAVLVLVLSGGDSKQARSLAEQTQTQYFPPPNQQPLSAYPPPAMQDPQAPPALEEASGEEAPPPQEQAPEQAPAEEQQAPPAEQGATGGQYSYQGYGGTGPTGTITTGCKGGNCGESGPTTASEGLDDQVADYEKLKSERRQAMDFCDAHFSSWQNIQKCISELFHNARY